MTYSIVLVANYVCVSASDHLKKNQENMKKFGSNESNMGWSGQRRTVRCHPPDSPVCIGQSSVCVVELSSLGNGEASLVKNHWTVREERRTVRFDRRPTASGATLAESTVGWVTGHSGAHPRIKAANQRFCDHCIGAVSCAADSSVHPRTEED
jgi:hypothetical protein